jgi:ribonuclease R
MDRYTAAFLDNRVGDTFAGIVRGVARFGLFVSLADSGADGLVPVSRLPGDYYVHDEARHALVGERSGRTWRLGDAVEVRLTEADGLTGSVVLDLLDGGEPQTAGRARTDGRARARGKGPKKPARRQGGRKTAKPRRK